MQTDEVHPLATSTGVSNPLVLLQSMIERGGDPDALGKMMALAEHWEANQAAKAFAAALTRFQSLCPAVFKHRVTKQTANFDGYNFASYDDVMRAAKPHLEACGIAISFSTADPGEKAGMLGSCRIRVGSHFEDTTLFIPIPAMKVNDTQKFGAAMSYLKRYLLCAALNIVVTDEDDDAAKQFESMSGDQIAKINDLMDAIRDIQEEATAAGLVLDRPFVVENFLAWLEVKTLADVPASKFKEAVFFLESKRDAKKAEVASKTAARVKGGKK